MSILPPKLKEGSDYVCLTHHWIATEGHQYMPGTVLRTGDAAVKKIDKNPVSLGAYLLKVTQ